MTKRYRFGVLIIFLVLASWLGTQYFLDRQQNERLWNVVNQYESNRFFPALGHINELQKRVDDWQQHRKIPKQELDAELNRISSTTQALQEVMEDRNKLFEDAALTPNHLVSTLLQIQTEFSNLKRNSNHVTLNLTEQDAKGLQDIDRQLRKIKEISKKVYGFDSGLTDAEWKQISERGFLNDDRLTEWYRHVEEVLP